MKQGATSFPSTFWVTQNRPFDAKTLFDSFDQALTDITDRERYKGLKFVVKNDIGTPKEYWFIKDYIPPSGTPIWDAEKGELVYPVPAYIPTLENGGLVPYLPEQEDWSDEIEVARLDAVNEAQEIINEHIGETDAHNINGQIIDAIAEHNTGERHIIDGEKEEWDAKYDKPVDGIPKNDLDFNVQSSLDKADSALQNFNQHLEDSYHVDDSRIVSDAVSGDLVLTKIENGYAWKPAAMDITAGENIQIEKVNNTLTISAIDTIYDDTEVKNDISSLEENLNSHIEIEDGDVHGINDLIEEHNTSLFSHPDLIEDINELNETIENLNGENILIKSNSEESIKEYIDGRSYFPTNLVTTDDTRLSDARPASDVSDWAKEDTKPKYTHSELIDDEQIRHIPSVDSVPAGSVIMRTSGGDVIWGKPLQTLPPIDERDDTDRVLKINSDNELYWGIDIDADTQPGTLSTSNESQAPSISEVSFAEDIILHNIARTGKYSDLLDKPEIPDVSEFVTQENIDTSINEHDIDSRHIITGEKDIWNAKYDLPETGVAREDLDASTKDSLSLADSALQNFDEHLENSYHVNDERIIEEESETDLVLTKLNSDGSYAWKPAAVDSYSKEESDNKYAEKEHTHTLEDITDYESPDFTGLATEKYVDDAIAALGDDEDTIYTAGTNIEISDENVISSTYQYDDTEIKNSITELNNSLTNYIDEKIEDVTLIAGENININSENVISAVDTIYDDTSVKNNISQIETDLDNHINSDNTHIPSLEEVIAGSVLTKNTEGNVVWGRPIQQLPQTTEDDVNKILKIDDEGNMYWGVDQNWQTSIGTLSTTNESQIPNISEASFTDHIKLHNISRTGKYEDLLEKPDIGSGIITINGESFNVNQLNNTEINITPESIGASVQEDIDTAISNHIENNFHIDAYSKEESDNLFSTKEEATYTAGTNISIENNVINSTYEYDDSEIKELISDHENIVDGTAHNINELIEAHNTDERHIISGEKEEWNNKYNKPNTGIPKSDLDESVQESLSKADTALQSFTELDPEFTAYKNIIDTHIENLDIHVTTEDKERWDSYVKDDDTIPNDGILTITQGEISETFSANQLEDIEIVITPEKIGAALEEHTHLKEEITDFAHRHDWADLDNIPSIDHLATKDELESHIEIEDGSVHGINTLIENHNTDSRHIIDGEKNSWNNKYDKPSTGIPESDLSQEIIDKLNAIDDEGVTSITAGEGLLGGEITTTGTIEVDFTKVATAEQGAKADTALQEEVDPIFTAYKPTIENHISDTDIHITSSERTNWNTAYDHSQSDHNYKPNFEENTAFNKNFAEQDFNNVITDGSSNNVARGDHTHEEIIDISYSAYYFIEDGTKLYHIDVANRNEPWNEPSNIPQYNGSDFTGWQLVRPSGTNYDKLKATKNIKLKALYGEAATYTVSFNVNGGNEVYQQQTVTYGNTATNPGSPTKDGYSFIEWQLNNTVFDFNTPITENIVLTAKWEEIVMPKIYFGSIIGATTTANDLATRFTAFDKIGNEQDLTANLQGGYGVILIPRIYGTVTLTMAGLPINMQMTETNINGVDYYQYRNPGASTAGVQTYHIKFN